MAVAAVHAAAVDEQLGAVGEGVFDGVGVEVLVDVCSSAVMAAAEPWAFTGQAFFIQQVVDVVNVEVAVAAAARPEEAVEALDLPEQFARMCPATWRRMAEPTGPCMR